MAEQFAHVVKTLASAATGNAYVNAVVAALVASSATRWTVSESAPGKALLECAATGAELVLHGVAAQVQVGFAPDGGVTDWSGTPTAPVWTGMRNITGGASTMTNTTSTINIAQYEDAILIAIGSTVAGWRFAAMAGTCLEPVDESDVARKIGGDALMIGVPANTSNPSGNWLTTSSTIGIGSCVRAESVFVQLGANPTYIISDPNSGAGRTLLRINGVERFVPYQMHIFLAPGLSQYIGATKYLRQWRGNAEHGTRLFSDTVGSQQAWHAIQYDATTRNLFTLWAKTETTV